MVFLGFIMNITSIRGGYFRRIFFAGFLFTAVFSWAQDKSPMSELIWSEDEDNTKHYGLSPKEWFCENSGYAFVDGETKYFYLYNTYTYNDGDYFILKSALFNWAINLGYAVKYINYGMELSEEDQDASIREMMIEGDYDVAAAVYEADGDTAFLYIYCWDQEKDFWWLEIFPLTLQ